jgi:hypothetical protein
LESRRSLVPFTNLMRDNVDVLKKDGTRIPGLRANVQRSRIFMKAETLLVEAGDSIVRHTSNGLEETYEVLDPGFCENMGGIPAHYQMRVRRLGALSGPRTAQSVTYNLIGPNARVNQGSTDQSVNIIGSNNEVLQLLADLRSAVESLDLPTADMASAVEILDSVQGQVESRRPSKTIVAALLGALPAVASVTATAASLIKMFS